MKKALAATLLFTLTTVKTLAFEGIKNPPIGNLGNSPSEAKSGNLFVGYFLNLWNVLITVGALAVLLFFLWGAITWITSSGDKSKMEEARNRMFNAFVGMFLLVTAYTIIGFISSILFGEDFNILKPSFFVAN
jgi:magnesium-transporting ATPase (P-type)